jgi:hypothetical protein
MAPNIRNRISMQPMKSHLSWSEGSFPCFLVGGHVGRRGFFSRVVFGVESGMFTFHLDIGVSMQEFFWGVLGSGVCQSKEFPSF